MRRTIRRAPVMSLVAALATLLLTAGCGDVGITADDDPNNAKSTPASTPEKVDTSAGEGNWLLGITTAGGADAETSSTVYITFNPSTGQATSHRLPGVQGASASPERAALLVSANRLWAIPDTGISRAEEKSGRLKVYSLTDGNPKVVDIRERAGKDDVAAIGWAFDPTRADTLRVVDTKNRVWAVNVAGGKATQESSLADGPWVFTNGFNGNTGQPWVESIDSDATNPPGNGPADTSPVTRNGGTVLPAGSTGFSQLPASPCRLGAGFTDETGVTWAFCADQPTVPTYYLAKDGKEWTAYGKPSAAVAPVAAGFPLVLPPMAP
jgi:hypothetical protein